MFVLPDLEKSRPLKHIALLTSGGDSPGMNAAIRAVVRTASHQQIRVTGIRWGFSGLVQGNFIHLHERDTANIIQQGGTLLKSDRCSDFLRPEVRQDAAERLRQQGVEALIVIGGDGSLTGALKLEEETGLPVLGIPATIDNDIYGTDCSIGFDTAVNTALDAIDRIRDTASAHGRLFLVEVMGHNAGFLALQVGLAGGAEAIVVPEAPCSVSELNQRVKAAWRRGKSGVILVLAEGGEAGHTYQVARELQALGEHRCRVCILGHTQRGGRPTGFDRVLASCFGYAAVTGLQAGYSSVMTKLGCNQIGFVPLTEALSQRKPLPQGYPDLAHILAT